MKRLLCWIFGHLATYHPARSRTLETCERCGRMRYRDDVSWGGRWSPR